ncbi:MAG: hypothetical protein OHK0044_10440 [Burkholderiaceae bacterium]
MIRHDTDLPVCTWKLVEAASTEAYSAHDPMVLFGAAVSEFGLTVQSISNEVGKHLFKDAEVARLIVRDVVALAPAAVEGRLIATFSQKLQPGLLDDSLSAARAAFAEQALRLLQAALLVHCAAADNDNKKRSTTQSTVESIARSVRRHLNRLAGARLRLGEVRRRPVFDDVLAFRTQPRAEVDERSFYSGTIERLDRLKREVRIVDGAHRHTLRIAEGERYAAAVAQLLELDVFATQSQADAPALEEAPFVLRYRPRQLDLDEEFAALKHEVLVRTTRQQIGDAGGNRDG